MTYLDITGVDDNSIIIKNQENKWYAYNQEYMIGVPLKEIKEGKDAIYGNRPVAAFGEEQFTKSRAADIS